MNFSAYYWHFCSNDVDLYDMWICDLFPGIEKSSSAVWYQSNGGFFKQNTITLLQKANNNLI